MIKKYFKYIILVFVFITFSYFNIFAQSNTFNKDSLLHQLFNSQDSTKASIYNNLAFIYLDSIGNQAIIFSEKAILLSKKYNQPQQEAYAHIMLGSAYLAKAKYETALKEFETAKTIAISTKNYNQLHTIFNNIGVIYKYIERYELALDSYHKALDYAKQSNDITTLVQTYNNIGNIYLLKDELNKGLHYFNLALDHCNKSKTFISYLPMIYNNIAYIKFYNKEYNTAKEAYNKAYFIFDSIDNKYGMAVTLHNLAEICIEENKLTEAEKLIFKADSIHNLMNYTESRINLYNTAYQLFKDIGDYKRALQFYEINKNLEDSIYTSDFNSKIAELETKFEVDKIKIENETKDYKIAHQKKINIWLSFIISIIVILSLILLVIIKQKNKLNNKLKIVNKKIKSKEIEIQENLEYARKIQVNCMNNNTDTLKNKLFIFDKPKSVVGGDFYFIRNKKNKLFIVLADATGHGISGGFLSVLGIEYIEQAINNNDDVNEIINHLNNRFYKSITESNYLSNESLCLSIISIDKDKVEFAGSKHKLWLFSSKNQELIEYKSDKQIIGLTNDFKYNKQEIDCEKGDILIMSSDGFPDQFGANNKGKLKYNRFRDILSSACLEDFSNIEEILEKKLYHWKFDTEQTDDILIIGIKI